MSAPPISRASVPGRPAGEKLPERPLTAGRGAAAITRPRLHWAVVFLLATWVMPFVIYAGPVRLSPYRIALLVLFVPCLVWLGQGRAGRMRLPDALLGLFCLWSIASLTAVHGSAIALQTGGILVLETLVPYLLARCCIRNADDFRALARLLTWIILALLPLAVFETFTGRNIYLELASYAFETIGVAEKDPRWGLRRAQLFFEHPILMGVCVGSVLALTHMVVGRELPVARRWLGSTMTGATAALSLSSGPLSALLVQIGLLAWNRALVWIKSRWIILIALILLFLFAVQLFAKRPLPNILLSFAFDPDSAFFRIVIWNYGTLSVANHPWFGVGMGPWDHPSWMSPSIDMFWLYNAITYGLPAGVLMLGFFAAATLSVALVRNLTPLHYDYRVAYLISMVSFFLTGWMVHYWNGTYVFFLFMVGAGVWLRDVPEARGSSLPRGTRLRTEERAGRSAAVRHRQPADRLLKQELKPVDRQPGRRRERQAVAPEARR